MSVHWDCECVKVFVWIFDYFIPRWWCFFFATQRPSSFSSNEERQGPQWEEPGLQKWRPSLAQSIWRGHLLRARWKKEKDNSFMSEWGTNAASKRKKYNKNALNKRCFNFKTAAPFISGCVSSSVTFRVETSALRQSVCWCQNYIRVTGFLKIALSVCSNLIMAPIWVRSARYDGQKSTHWLIFYISQCGEPHLFIYPHQGYTKVKSVPQPLTTDLPAIRLDNRLTWILTVWHKNGAQTPHLVTCTNTPTQLELHTRERSGSQKHSRCMGSRGQVERWDTVRADNEPSQAAQQDS